MATTQAGLKLLQPACLCLGLFKELKELGLGGPFGKASWADPVFGLGRFVSMRGRGTWRLEGGSGYPSEAWPDEALERGLSRP